MPYFQVEPSPVKQTHPHRIKETAPLQETTPTTCHFLSQAMSRFKNTVRYFFKSYLKAFIFFFVSGYHVRVTNQTSDPELELPLCFDITLFFELYILYHSSSALLVWVPVACLNLFKQQADFLEGSTRGQSSSVVWFEHQIGRITASVIGSVSKCKECAYPYSLVNSIMQYSKPPSEWTCSQMGMSEWRHCLQVVYHSLWH